MGTIGFQLPHPRGVRPTIWPCWKKECSFQLPHPRGVRHHILLSKCGIWYFNSRTQTIMCFPPHIQKLAIKFFNSRTPRGVRPGSAWIQTGFSHFNSRTRVGCDNTDRSSLHNGLVFSTHAPRVEVQRCSEPATNHASAISTHAPHAGHDIFATFSPLSLLYFNSRTYEGCDYKEIRPKYQSVQFQLTHPYRVWLFLPKHLSAFIRFQLTHP